MTEPGDRSTGVVAAGATRDLDPSAPVTTTFLFTDIEGSTRLARAAGDTFSELLAVHRRLLRDVFAANGGREVGTEGDSFFVVFPTPRQAVAAAVEAQRALSRHPWPEGRAIRVRMGLHTGEATPVEGDVIGLEVHRAARISATGHGGQVLLSEATAALVRDSLPAGTSLRDLGAYGLKDFGRPERLHQLDIDGLPAAFPALRASTSAPGVPVPATTLVGRGGELADLRRLLGRERLITLTGPGGIGKTRLVLLLAAEVAHDFADGAVFVPLASVQDATLVPTTIARALDVREEGCDDALDAIIARLSEREVLLVLDNFEQVIGAAPAVAALVERVRQLRVVVTSREALRLRAEREYPVPPLPVDDAVRLFAQRAAAVRYDFAVDEANAATLDRIATMLEGVPLAIELAAARIRVLPADAILDRLSHGLDLLTGGPRDLPERQRALRTTLDWSYDLLDDGDRRLFARLGVFTGTFSLDAAEAVSGADVLAGLASLVDKSLVRAEPDGHEARYRMLSMVREYACEKLAAAGELEAVGGRHAEYYGRLSVRMRRALRGPDQRLWARRLSGSGSGDIDNLRGSLRWYLDHGDRDEVGRIVWSMWLLGWVSGRLEECRWWARQGLAADGSLSEKGRARLLTVAGLMETWTGDYGPALPALAEAVGIARRLGDDDLLANSLMGLGLITCFAESIEAGRARVEEARALFRARGDHWGLATSTAILTWLHVAEDDYDGAVPLFDEALAVAEGPADELNRAMIETNVAELRLHQGDHAEAGRRLVSSLRRYQELKAYYPSSYAIDAAAHLAAGTARAAAAALLLGGADRARESIGAPAQGVHRSRRHALEEQLRDQLGAVAVDQALARGRGLRWDEVLDAALAVAGAAAEVDPTTAGPDGPNPG